MPITCRRSGPCALLLVGALAAVPAPARSDEPPGEDVELSVNARESGRATLQERPFAFVNDPSTPSKGTTSVSYALGLGSGIAADRPLPASIAASGISNGVTVSHGLTDRFAPFLSVTMAENSATHVRAGASYQLWNPRAPLRIAVTGAVLREGTSGAAGGAFGVAASLDQGPVRFAADVRGEKVFSANRDSIDVFTLAGVSYRVASWMRVGAEYVGEDLEEAFGEDAEGGARQTVGPSVAFDLDHGRYQVAVATGFGLGAKSPGAIARAALAFNF